MARSKKTVAARRNTKRTTTPRKTATKADKQVAKVTKTKEVRTVDVPLEGEILEFVAANARPAVTPCLCGCGNTTKGRFFPGHDAVLHARLDATVAAGGENADLARVALVAFGWPVRHDIRLAKAEAKAAAKAEPTEPTPEPVEDAKVAA